MVTKGMEVGRYIEFGINRRTLSVGTCDVLSCIRLCELRTVACQASLPWDFPSKNISGRLAVSSSRRYS